MGDNIPFTHGSVRNARNNKKTMCGALRPQRIAFRKVPVLSGEGQAVFGPPEVLNRSCLHCTTPARSISLPSSHPHPKSHVVK